MDMFRWYERLHEDRRVVGLGEADRDGGIWWLFVDCKSAIAAESLFDELWEQGHRRLARRTHYSLWLEPMDDL